MIPVDANYGYKDGSGEFLIIVDTDRCVDCPDKPCVGVCPKKVLEVIVDDYDDEVVAVKEEHRKKIKYSCAQGWDLYPRLLLTPGPAAGWCLRHMRSGGGRQAGAFSGLSGCAGTCGAWTPCKPI